MKKILILSIVIILTSCNSIYKSHDTGFITQVRIKNYENYYETSPISEAFINNPTDIKKIKRMLKWMPAKGGVYKDFHDFTESKIIIEIYSDDNFWILRIIDGRVEVTKDMYYSRILIRERKFTSYIEGL